MTDLIEKLEGEPNLPFDEQIREADLPLPDRSAEELDQLLADLLNRPTLASAGEESAAKIFYEPTNES